MINTKKLKKVKYKVGPNELISLIPYCAIIECYILFEGDSKDALLYFPEKLSWELDEEKGIDIGCPSLGFAVFNPDTKLWTKSKLDYLNLK